MSDFVNPKKRGVTLPPGCKDLVDLLKASKQKSATWDYKIKQGCLIKIRERLGALGRYVEMTFNTKMSGAHLTLTSLDNHVRFLLHYHKNESRKLFAHVEAETKTKEETAVTAFLERNGWKNPADEETTHVFLFPTLPIQLLCEIDPLPSEPASVTRLATELFRDCCGLADTDELEITFVEATVPPEAYGGTHGKAD